MAIYVWGYLKEYAEERREVLEAVEGVLESGKLILGPNVEAFEAEFAAYCGARHGIGVDNGTNAIFLALKAVGVEPGDEVITVTNTAVPTVSAIVSAGAVPRFVDIDPATYLMDTRRLEDAVTPKTRCIVPVHLYGQCVDMDAVRAVAARHDLKVVEDCAQAHGARFKGNVAGSMSDASAFSFYPTKILGTYGDGGMVLTSDDEVRGRMRRLRFYGMESTYYANEHGYNSRLDELHAAILRNKLKRLDGYIARRRELAERYDGMLAGTGLVLPACGAGNFHAYYLYVVRHPARDEIIAKLKENDIHVNISYPWPIHTMDGYARFGGREGDLPHAEAAAREIFSLPMFPSLDNDDQDEVCRVLGGILESL
ncbi:MAG: DegT/DnrJ/EryC1/StrS family aminotransferase [Desulfovibrionaceae bacterium]|nr:DegT/DnrJ/EryC1/StrS family aminotransferase [Desulfovibrionaceae bacterium]